MINDETITQSRNQRISGYVLAALAAILWSFIGPLSKGAIAEDISPIEVAFWRAALGGLCFAVQTIVSRSMRIPLRHAAIFFLFGGWSIGVLFVSLQVSIKLSGAAMAMVLLYTAPAWVAIASRLLFREPLSRQKLLGLGVALVGTGLICSSGGSLSEGYSVLGIACGLVSGLAYASHFPFFVWWKSRYSTATIYTYMLLGGTAFMFPLVDFAPDKSWQAWGTLSALGILTNYAAYRALAGSLRRIGQVEAAVIGNIEPVLATLWVWLFYEENFTAAGWLGCGLVIGAVFLLTLERSSRPPE